MKRLTRMLFGFAVITAIMAIAPPVATSAAPPTKSVAFVEKLDQPLPNAIVAFAGVSQMITDAQFVKFDPLATLTGMAMVKCDVIARLGSTADALLDNSTTIAGIRAGPIDGLERTTASTTGLLLTMFTSSSARSDGLTGSGSDDTKRYALVDDDVGWLHQQSHLTSAATIGRTS